MLQFRQAIIFFQGTDAIQHAQLVNASDLTQQKTLAVDMLGDRKRFETGIAGREWGHLG